MGLRVRVLLIDDHPVVTQGLAASLGTRPEIEIVATAGSVAEARAHLAAMAVDVGLVDIRLPDGSGLDLLGAADARGRRTAWVVLSSFESEQYVATAIRLGAVGYVLKTAALAQIVKVITEAAAGETTFSPSQLAVADGASSLVLSEREHLVVTGLVGGRSNDEIAASLAVATKTVEAYLTRLYVRFGVASRTELALLAEREGLLDLPHR